LKSLVKNHSSFGLNLQNQGVQNMQRKLVDACLGQGLKITTVIGYDDSKKQAYLHYQIAFNSDEPTVFSGQANHETDQHYCAMLDLVNGRMVSEIFPPTIRSVSQEGEGNAIVDVPVAYWKRRLIAEHDITLRDPDPKSSMTDGLHKVRSSTAWVGFNSNGEEIARVFDGSANKDPESVERVQYMELGPRGTVVVVLYKDTKSLKEGEQGTLSEHLKTTLEAMYGPSKTQDDQSETTSTAGCFATPSPPDVSLSSQGAAASSSAASAPAIDISKIAGVDLSRMSLEGTMTNKDPKLVDAVNRLASSKKSKKLDIPYVTTLRALARRMGAVTDLIPNETEAMIRVAKEVGMKNPVLSSRVGQKQAASIVEKFGFKPVLLTGAGSIEKTTAAKKTVVKKPAASRGKKS